MYKKILCLGTNSEITDRMATDIAEEYFLTNRGLISHETVITDIAGSVYHTSLADISTGRLIEIAGDFDLVIMLDQHKSEWSHWKLLEATYKAMVELEQSGINTQFRQNKNIHQMEKIEKLVTENRSWCIYPWINLVARDHTGLHLCARSDTITADSFSLEEWKNSTTRKDVQEKMLQGQLLPGVCEKCYMYERHGIESYRQFESREWCNQLDITELEDLKKISSPKYYEIHWGNKCNIKCRGCVPSRSSAIETEFRRYDIKLPFDDVMPEKYPSVDIVDIDQLDRHSRVYISGGEPTIMPETMEFMRRCRDADKTDFELTMSTNGVKFSQEFVDLSRSFKNLNLSFSLDGYGKINDYWRSGSSWEKIVANMHLAKELGHNVTVNTVPGIYNATNLHLLLEWLDEEFPMTAIYMQINHVGFQSVFNHPDREAVIKSMRLCQKTKIYWSNGKSCRTSIDSILSHYEKNVGFDQLALREFFQFNDQLDSVRKTHLKDFIPELEACRVHII